VSPKQAINNKLQATYLKCGGVAESVSETNFKVGEYWTNLQPRT